MPDSSPLHEVIAVAKSYDWVREVGNNRGEAVSHFLSITHLGPGYPWCAAFVAFVGDAVLGERWPLPLVAGCATLYETADAKGLVDAEPRIGDVFLIWYPKKNRFAHTGFIVGREDDVWLTVEGNTSDPEKPATREGWGVFKRERKFAPRDRFIHWEDGLLP